MSTQILDLRPPSTRLRAERARVTGRSLRIAAGLVLAGAVAVAAAESLRHSTHVRVINAQMEAERAAGLRCARGVALLELQREQQLEAERHRIPLRGVLALIASTLKEDAFISAIRFQESGAELRLHVALTGSDHDSLAEQLRHSLPWMDVQVRSDGIEVILPRDRSFDVVFLDAERGSTHDP